MKIVDLKKAEAMYEYLTKEIKELEKVKEKLWGLCNGGTPEKGHYIISDCRDQFQVEIKRVRKVREELEVG